jgi:hypothetical protein
MSPPSAAGGAGAVAAVLPSREDLELPLLKPPRVDPDVPAPRSIAAPEAANTSSAPRRNRIVFHTKHFKRQFDAIADKA